MTQISSFPKKNKPGRVGIRRRRPTTNQALRAYCFQLETKLNAAVPKNELVEAHKCIRYVEQITSKSRTGAAHKVHEYVAGFLAGTG